MILGRRKVVKGERLGGRRGGDGGRGGERWGKNVRRAAEDGAAAEKEFFLASHVSRVHGY